MNIITMSNRILDRCDFVYFIQTDLYDFLIRKTSDHRCNLTFVSQPTLAQLI